MDLMYILGFYPSALWAGSGWGWGLLRRWSASTMWAGPLIFSSTTTRDVWIIPSFRIWDYVLHVEHVSCVVTNCGQHQWVIPFPLNSSFSPAGGKHYQKIFIPVFRLVLQNFAFPGCFLYILFHSCLFSLLSTGLFVITVCGSISVQASS